MTPSPTGRIKRASGRPPIPPALRLPASPSTIADRVAAILVDHIRRNRLAAGTPLPSEIQTSAQLAVSRGVVREAYRALSSAGVVEIANGRSPRVGYISHRSLLRLIQHALWTQQASAEQILELRSPIEERAAQLAATHRTALDVEGLRRAVAAMGAAGARSRPTSRRTSVFTKSSGGRRATRSSAWSAAPPRIDGVLDPRQSRGPPLGG